MSNISIYMKKLFKKLKKLLKQKKGFTLIELLVVIGILGILAAALVATINPFEQLAKAQDANVENTMVEYITANIRYYATNNGYPWSAGIAACAPSATNDTNTDSAGAPYEMPLCAGGNSTTGVGCNPSMCINPLITDRELEASFVTAVGSLSQIYVTYYGDTGGTAGSSNANTLVACFVPGSQSGKKGPSARYKQDGSDDTGCISQCSGTPSVCGTKACYWCTR